MNLEFKKGLNFYCCLDVHYDKEHPGCPGCCPKEDDSFDVCRCGIIIDPKVKNFSSASFTDHLIDVLDLFHVVGIPNRKKERMLFTYCVERLVRTMGINEESFIIEVENGYYGEEIKSVRLHSSVEGDLYEKLAILCRLDQSDRIRFVLKLEYGFVLPKLENLDFDMVEMKRSDVVVPNSSYVKKLNYKIMSAYYDWTLPVCVVDDSNLLVDGYHRFFAKEGKKKILVIKGQKRACS